MTLLSFEKTLGTRWLFTTEVDSDAWESMDRCGKETPAVWLPLEIHAYDSELRKEILVYSLDLAFAVGDSAPDFYGEYEWLIDPETLSKGVKYVTDRFLTVWAGEIATALEPSARQALKNVSEA